VRDGRRVRIPDWQITAGRVLSVVALAFIDMDGTSAETLFDDYERNDYNPPLFSESTYTYLNRSADKRWSQTRDLLEGWFAEYPDEQKAKFRTDFSVSDQGQHLGAWWELYIYTLYRRIGYDNIEIHPELDDIPTHPDYLVTSNDNSMYVECIVTSTSDAPITRNPGVEAAIYDAVNDITDTNFLVGLKFKKEGKQHPSRREIIAGIGNWLKKLNPDDVEADLKARLRHPRPTSREGLPIPRLDRHRHRVPPPSRKAAQACPAAWIPARFRCIHREQRRAASRDGTHQRPEIRRTRLVGQAADRRSAQCQ